MEQCDPFLGRVLREDLSMKRWHLSRDQRRRRNEPGEDVGAETSRQRGSITPSERNPLAMWHQRYLSNAIVEGCPPSWAESCPLVSSEFYTWDITQWLSSHPQSGMWLFFFTFNLHCKLERNELHPPGFLCSVQLRKAISCHKADDDTKISHFLSAGRLSSLNINWSCFSSIKQGLKQIFGHKNSNYYTIKVNY